MRKVAIVGMGLALAGCMHQSIPQALGRMVNEQPVDAARSVNGAKFDPAHRQYYDQRHKRFYYFDRAKKQYFWESGEPK